MRAVCDEAAAPWGARRRPGVLPRPRGLRPASPSTSPYDVLARPGRRPGGDALSRSRPQRAPGVTYVKPHGALYNRVVDDEEQARAVLAGSGDLPVLGLPGAVILELAASRRPTFLEGFPDRGYTRRTATAGAARPSPAPVHDDPDEIAAHAVRLAARAWTRCACTGTRRPRWPRRRALSARALDRGRLRPAEPSREAARRSVLDAVLVEVGSTDGGDGPCTTRRGRPPWRRATSCPAARTVLFDGVATARTCRGAPAGDSRSRARATGSGAHRRDPDDLRRRGPRRRRPAAGT